MDLRAEGIVWSRPQRRGQHSLGEREGSKGLSRLGDATSIWGEGEIVFEMDI